MIGDDVDEADSRWDESKSSYKNISIFQINQWISSIIIYAKICVDGGPLYAKFIALRSAPKKVKNIGLRCGLVIVKTFAHIWG